MSDPTYQTKTTWEKYYSSKEGHGSLLSPPVTDSAAELSPAFWHNVTALFQEDDSAIQDYIARKSRRFVRLSRSIAVTKRREMVQLGCELEDLAGVSLLCHESASATSSHGSQSFLPLELEAEERVRIHLTIPAAINHMTSMGIMPADTGPRNLVWDSTTGTLRSEVFTEDELRNHAYSQDLSYYYSVGPGSVGPARKLFLPFLESLTTPLGNGPGQTSTDANGGTFTVPNLIMAFLNDNQISEMTAAMGILSECQLPEWSRKELPAIRVHPILQKSKAAGSFLDYCNVTESTEPVAGASFFTDLSQDFLTFVKP
ncbi:histidine acid phosphatase [Penicillium cinerascens]|uniref:Histidine acid phosphatase n=1 Tax=Penicillium cinerascens TaxID=70096 RepID=A0A9W9J6N7_9EURO|nr:histidine acid phosphatase [Penicillium cinerascens]KAJ5190877.1 histidine acid phosphatase [Penicillium cinerascens]